MTTPSTAGRPDSDDGSERYFEAIGPRQCFDLIEAHHLGRIAWQAADRPQILPVTYALHEGSVYFSYVARRDLGGTGSADKRRA
jgi:hypothetical protein